MGPQGERTNGNGAGSDRRTIWEGVSYAFRYALYDWIIVVETIPCSTPRDLHLSCYMQPKILIFVKETMIYENTSLRFIFGHFQRE